MGWKIYSRGRCLSCSRRWSITAIWSRGSSSPNRPAPGCGICRCWKMAPWTLDGLPELLTPEVKLFAFTHISDSSARQSRRGTPVAKAQAVGAVRLRGCRPECRPHAERRGGAGCGFLVFSGHKMCGPTEIGARCTGTATLEARPPWHGGGEMIVSVLLPKVHLSRRLIGSKPAHRT